MLERIHFEIIVAVEELGTVTSAAKKLHLSQSALSHSMRKLEKSLGLEIWQRQGRRLVLTQAGEYLLAVAERSLTQFNHAEERLRLFAQGQKGILRVGMECHPCYQWLLKVVAPYLISWPSVDIDIKQKFQFGGIGALFGYEIDMLVTPDPLFKKKLLFEPVFDYEQVLVVGKSHELYQADFINPEDLSQEIVITYPVSIDRLDIFSQFMTPAGIYPKEHKVIENTDIMLQMVESGRGVAALPRWLVEESSKHFQVAPVALGSKGIQKQIYLGIREDEVNIDYISAFLQLAREQCYVK
ncbi:MAG: LysR family transcriptional regulator [Candidatus Caenarcaniphilales bacterium]|nr:LysR family transcriptional regulator [Candidatus Caenarcaniphilales bacterium]